ncbi:RsmB/NOP family class I SAM-dependent RNA methyltransferase [Candidatus Woesearchaeota archaeon]|nr:RsmB/NOP family class I SAM-dependent RNA methyltransferase [Candidatus Woesearchaeota archaeon]
MALKPIPQEIEFKPAFEERYRNLMGDRYEEYKKFSSSYIRKCIRVNTLKISVKELKKRLEGEWKLTPVPWCKEAFWIEKKGEARFDIGNLVEHQLGFIYIQESASMIPPVVLAPKPGEKVLDMCSAPGSKTTQLAMYMENEGVLVANDVDWTRLKPLGLNLQRCGITNTIVMMKANRRLERESFDKVSVDAPCSGTGTIRRSLKTMRMWSPGLVKRMARDQRRIIQQGFDLLKPGGTLVYSTCTQEPEENEAIVTWLLEKNENAKLQDIKLDIKRSDVITEWEGTTYHKDIKKVLRIYPQDNDTEGFFVAKVRKINHDT